MLDLDADHVSVLIALFSSSIAVALVLGFLVACFKTKVSQVRW